MTLVAVWRSGEEHIAAAADTRIVRESGNILTEHGPKILPLTVRGKRPSPTGFFDQSAFQFDVGFAYSGATLPALSTHALANTLLGSLVSSNGTPPLLKQIVDLIAKIAVGYIHEVGQINGRGAQFTAVVFGFCPIAQQLQAFEIRPHLTRISVECEIIEHRIDKIGAVVIIGSSPALLRDRIKADKEAATVRGDFHPVLEIDRPARALKALIDEEADPNVGGVIQKGWATHAGFQIQATMMPVKARPPSPRNAGLFVLGFDIMDMEQIGENHIGLIGR